MGSDLLVLLVLAVVPGADDLPASVASNRTTAVREFESSEANRAISGKLSTGHSSRRRIAYASPPERAQVAQGAPGMRLTSAQDAGVLDNQAIHTSNAAVAESAVVATEGCACASCAEPRGHHHHNCRGLVGLPSPCHSPGDMTLHIPYVAHPQNYYYFRPYNYFHIAEHQREVANYGGDPNHPYANRLFERVYARTVDPYRKDLEPELITPIPPSQLR